MHIKLWTQVALVYNQHIRLHKYSSMHIKLW